MTTSRTFMIACLAASLSMPIAANAADTEDLREPIAVPSSLRNEILQEMRHMLEQLQVITLSLAEGDRDGAASAATEAGMAAAMTSDHDLPEAFVEFRAATHATFDDLASEIDGGEGDDAPLQSLAALMGNCVACHSNYRLEVSDTD